MGGGVGQVRVRNLCLVSVFGILGGVGGATSNATARAHDVCWVLSIAQHDRAGRAVHGVSFFVVAWGARGHEAPQTTSSTL